MLQTLFYIPAEVLGLPVLGVGLLLFFWALLAGVIFAYQYRWGGWNADLINYTVFAVLIGAAIVWLLPQLAERIPGSDARGIPIRGYGVMLLVAVVSGVALALHRAKAEGLPGEVIFSLAVWLVVAGIIGARIFYVIEYRQNFDIRHPDGSWDPWGSLVAAINMQKGGLVVFGSLIGAMAGMSLFCWKTKINFLALADLIAPSMAVGQAIGRLGCFLNGCCYGGECDLPWGVRFPPESPVYIQQVEQGRHFIHGLQLSWQEEELPAIVTAVEKYSAAEKAGLRPGLRIRQIIVLNPGATNPRRYPPVDLNPAGGAISARYALQVLLQERLPGTELTLHFDGLEPPVHFVTAGLPTALPVHPTQIYSALDAFFLAWVLWTFTPLRRRHGQVLALTLILHAISRFLLEMIRVDEANFLHTGLSISQNLSLGMFAVGVLLWAWVSWGAGGAGG
ncbi:MAG: prolipoprotein diacylglyceryl transferase, partial [Pirellulales bacterium]|nr:prolipoprotein diacylglyceryl transferase [Pirellulales bacterium]